MQDLITAIGGIGVFLLGMVVMTEGLKSLGGARISAWLADATRSPASGAVTGAIGTAILQSSSATTVAAVGFVGAGILTFSQSLGIIFGANLGTTITGWMVALVGFKLQLGSLLLPLIFVGVMLRIFASQRTAQIGLALAGFGLIFLGIDLLQTAAADHADFVDMQMLPADSWFGRIRLVLIGILITVITQSSSAGVAAALVAINAGAINFEQGAALVIGMDVGTTITAAIATIGGSRSARRTGFSHVIYNCLTALGALLLIAPFVFAWETTLGPLESSPEIGLVAFHSSFNLLGAVIVLPFTRHFANLMYRLVPEDVDSTSPEIDPAVLKEPAVALLTAERVIRGEFLTLMININLILEEKEHVIRADMTRLKQNLDRMHDLLDRIEIGNPDSRDARGLIALLHTIDHMRRLHERCDEDLQRAVVASRRQEIRSVEEVLDRQIDVVIEAIQTRDFEQARQVAAETYTRILALEDPQREELYTSAARGEIGLRYATECAEALRWLTRVSRHISRICFYLDRTAGNVTTPSQ